ncbi:MAG: Crp/Fnr family transcriptional regulator [Chromatiales bacterium]|nr:MAG: Crp/Fnr family transcriptional regulator [Chromatiales bacterium]
MSCGNGVCPFSEFRAEGGPLSDPEIDCIIDGAAQTDAFEPGETLFLQGQSSTSLYSLTAGMVKICSHSADGREHIVGLSSPGKMLLGLQSLNENRYAYTAIAATAVRACKINHHALLARVHDNPEVALRLIAAINAQLAHSRALMEVVGHSNAMAKIASFILLMMPGSEHGTCGFSMPFSRSEIAGILGLSEETVCRLMANMKRSGAIDAPRGKIEIHDWNQLHAIAEGDRSAHRIAELH